MTGLFTFDPTNAQYTGLLGATNAIGQMAMPSRMPIGNGAVLGNAAGGLLGGAGEAYTNQIKQSVARLHNVQAQNIEDQQKQWQALLGGGFPGAPQSGGTITPTPGINPNAPSPGPMSAPGGGNTLNRGSGSPMGTIPPNLLPVLSAMGPQQGSAFLAQVLAKNMETGEWQDSEKDGIKGLQNVRTGEFKPYNPNFQGAWEPIAGGFQRNKLSGEIKPIDPTMVKVANNLVGPEAGAIQSAKDLSDIGRQYYDEAKAARTQARDFKTMGALLDKGVTTGFGAELKMQIARAAKSAGIEFDANIPDTEMFQALSQNMQINAQPKGQGAVSNFERELFSKAVVNLGKTTEGNKLLIDYYGKIKQQDAEVAKMYEQELEKNGRVTPAFLTKVREHYEKPIFSKEDLERMQSIASAPAAPAAQAAPTAAVPDRAAVEAEMRRRGLLK